MVGTVWITAAILLLASWALFAFVWYDGRKDWLGTDCEKLDKPWWLKYAPAVMAITIPVLIAVVFFVPMMMQPHRQPSAGGPGADRPVLENDMSDFRGSS